MNLFGRLLPVEGYYVVCHESLTMNYGQSLTHLYQPLIGIEAISLYNTLLHEIGIQETNKPQTHHVLMNYLRLPLDQIFEARQKLEAIGLMQTFQHELSGQKVYEYLLKSPFAPEGFFKDGMLSELLLHHLGEKKCDLLRKRFIQEPNDELKKEVTAAFNEVFQSFHPSYDAQDNTLESVQTDLEGSTEVSRVDFEWLEECLKSRMIPFTRILNPSNKRLIRQMSSLYQLETFEIEKSLLWALNEENELTHSKFKEACHDIHNKNHGPVNLKLKTQQKSVQAKNVEKSVNKPQTKAEELLHQFETMSPKQILEDLSNGNQASSQDLKLIRDVMTEQGLNPPVMNVLIHYVLLQTNMKLSKAYLETIASHWSRSKLQTAKEAMDFARQEIERRKEKAQEKKQGYRRNYKKEVIPEWMAEKEQNSKQVVNGESKNKRTNEHSQLEVDQLLDRFIKTPKK